MEEQHLTSQQKEMGYETWRHIWHVQRLLVACQNGLIKDDSSITNNFVHLLKKVCSLSFQDTLPLVTVVEKILNSIELSIESDAVLIERIVGNTIRAIKKESSNGRFTPELICLQALSNRMVTHDQSKFSPTEIELFSQYTPLLKTTEFGSPEYKSFLEGLKPALDCHYAHNRHHPEHFENGLNDMTLIDCIEMCCDWTASGLRGKNGSFAQSIVITRKRFGYGILFSELMTNTYVEYLDPIRDMQGSDYLKQSSL